ncbi:MAG: PAS domain S-box protein [Gracilimonas sp.]|uniref:sensor histidine kinase n=1 Tax=Gracilimonas sp. TaxID=1974203 RepID=UPI001B1E186C|nr:histidine kinase dimerization/phosphoacceptor domain -containing protein [Gracilimonas sp.]MBO6584798.1 PAS domain S-box protein [Gracilimonas sp.]MBO6615931.1 PAS domain S-box protein [Gracilimonas sp.]
MDTNRSFAKSSFRRLHIDRKMMGILVVFTVLGIFLTISVIVATNTLSGLRGYSTFQVNWTEARKDAAFHLLNYINTGDDVYLVGFKDAMQLIDNASNIRSELKAEDTDTAYLRKLFIECHTVPDDIDNMIRTYQWFHSFGDFQIAIQEWIDSDGTMREMEELANEAQMLVNTNSLTLERQQELTNQVLALDQRLRGSKLRLAAALSSGTQLLNFIMLWIAVSLGLILLITGGMLSFRFLKSIKNWEREIEINEQKYRSLYEQNPNAVFSLSRDGLLISANQVFEKAVGMRAEVLRGSTIDRFVEKSDIKKLQFHFHRTLEGTPQHYETAVVLKKSAPMHVEVTNLPMVVDGEIIGVYGIARDITYRKEAELKIKEQLEEKTHLIAEVHDRVKNNLALVSSLIQLQQNLSKQPSSGSFFDNTISRIHSMAMVHERLYQNETFSSIRMDEYVNELLETIQRKYSSPSANVELITQTNPVTLSIKQSIPTGLLLNELLVNAFKHGITEDKGKIEVYLSQEDDEVVIKVSDTGPGLCEDFDLKQAKTLGMTLISVLLRQLDADYQLSNEEGTTFTIRFNGKDALSRTG